MKRRPPKIVGCSPEDLALLDEKVVKGTVKNETHGTPVSVSRLTYKPGDSAWGTGLARRESKRQNTKVPSPLRASAPPAGCQRMGHTHAFGSTEEPLRRTVFGCLERAPLSGPRFDHTTGEGLPQGRLPRRAAPQEQPGRAALSRVLRGHSLRRGPPPPLPRQARLGQETRPRRHQVQLVPPARIPLAPPRSDQHGGGLH